MSLRKKSTKAPLLSEESRAAMTLCELREHALQAARLAKEFAREAAHAARAYKRRKRADANQERRKV